MNLVDKVKSVFTNYRSSLSTSRNFLRQSKPNVGTYAWMPNTPIRSRQGPHERGATFVNSGKSGTGTVGKGSDNTELLTGKRS